MCCMFCIILILLLLMLLICNFLGIFLSRLCRVAVRPHLATRVYCREFLFLLRWWLLLLVYNFLSLFFEWNSSFCFILFNPLFVTFRFTSGTFLSWWVSHIRQSFYKFLILKMCSTSWIQIHLTQILLGCCIIILLMVLLQIIIAIIVHIIYLIQEIIF